MKFDCKATKLRIEPIEKTEPNRENGKLENPRVDLYFSIEVCEVDEA